MVDCFDFACEEAGIGELSLLGTDEAEADFGALLGVSLAESIDGVVVRVTCVGCGAAVVFAAATTCDVLVRPCGLVEDVEADRVEAAGRAVVAARAALASVGGADTLG